MERSEAASASEASALQRFQSAVSSIVNARQSLSRALPSYTYFGLQHELEQPALAGLPGAQLSGGDPSAGNPRGEQAPPAEGATVGSDSEREDRGLGRDLMQLLLGEAEQSGLLLPAHRMFSYRGRALAVVNSVLPPGFREQQQGSQEGNPSSVPDVVLADDVAPYLSVDGVTAFPSPLPPRLERGLLPGKEQLASRNWVPWRASGSGGGGGAQSQGAQPEKGGGRSGGKALEKGGVASGLAAEPQETAREASAEEGEEAAAQLPAWRLWRFPWSSSPSEGTESKAVPSGEEAPRGELPLLRQPTVLTRLRVKGEGLSTVTSVRVQVGNQQWQKGVVTGHEYLLPPGKEPGRDDKAGWLESLQQRLQLLQTPTFSRKTAEEGPSSKEALEVEARLPISMARQLSSSTAENGLRAQLRSDFHARGSEVETRLPSVWLMDSPSSAPEGEVPPTGTVFAGLIACSSAAESAAHSRGGFPSAVTDGVRYVSLRGHDSAPASEAVGELVSHFFSCQQRGGSEQESRVERGPGGRGAREGDRGGDLTGRGPAKSAQQEGGSRPAGAQGGEAGEVGKGKGTGGGTSERGRGGAAAGLGKSREGGGEEGTRWGPDLREGVVGWSKRKVQQLALPVLHRNWWLALSSLPRPQAVVVVVDNRWQPPIDPYLRQLAPLLQPFKVKLVLARKQPASPARMNSQEGTLSGVQLRVVDMRGSTGLFALRQAVYHSLSGRRDTPAVLSKL